MSVETLEQSLSDWIQQVSEGHNVFTPIFEKNREEIHSLAYVLYHNQRYEESSHFFRLLTIAFPLEAKFWKGLGACLQMQKDYDEALNCYLTCSQLLKEDQLDPYLYVQVADCYFALNEVNVGLKALEKACLMAKKTDDTSILQHVAFMRQRWSQSSQ